MSDLIKRQDVIDVIKMFSEKRYEEGITSLNRDDVISIVESIRPAQINGKEYRKQGEWEMFELITDTWYGKQYYFLEDNGIVYSRNSRKYMTADDAILEFLKEIGDE